MVEIDRVSVSDHQFKPPSHPPTSTSTATPCWHTAIAAISGHPVSSRDTAWNASRMLWVLGKVINERPENKNCCRTATDPLTECPQTGTI